MLICPEPTLMWNTSDNNNRATNQGVATGDESADADVRYVKETFQP